MLQMIWLDSLAAKKKWIQNASTLSAARWIVGDLSAKGALTEQLMAQQNCLEGNRVLRATELWALLLRKNQPEVRLLQSAGSQAFVRSFLSHAKDIPWCHRPGAATHFLSDLKALGVFPAHPDAEAILYNYKTDFNLSDDDPFLQTAFLASRFYQYCQSEKTLPWVFAPLALSQLENLEHVKGPFVFDLGFSLTLVEKDLIHSLAKTEDVYVLIPGGDPSQIKGRGLWAYMDLGLGVPQVSEQKEVASPGGKRSVFHHNAFGLEVRHAAHRVVELISQGASPHRIAIICQNLQSYGPALRRELLWEGIPVDFDLESAFLSRVDVQKVLNGLRLQEGSLNPERLQTVFGLSYAKLTQLRPVQNPNHIYDSWLREKVQKLQISPTKTFSISEYQELVVQAVETWADATENFWASVLSDLKQEAPPLKLPLKQWNDFLELLWQKKALVTSSGHPQGVRICDFSESESLDVDHILFLDLSESPLQTTVVSQLDLDRLKYFTDLGFDFSKSSKVQSDQILEWLQTHYVDSLFSYSQVNADGSIKSPSGFWVTQERDLGLGEPSYETKWSRVLEHVDSLQKEILHFKNLDPQQWEGLTERLQSDQSLKVQLKPTQDQPLPFSVSASALETYLECPFKFFADRFLKLRDLEDLDIQPNPMDRGQWLHKVIELMALAKKPLDSWTETEWDAILSDLAVKQKTVAPETWPVFQKQLMRQLKNFVALEKKWDPTMASAQYVEAKVEGFIYWNSQGALDFVKEASEIPQGCKFVPFKGKIDRIDITKAGHALLVDYKSSQGSCKNMSAWYENGDLQMPLYTRAIEKGLMGESYSVIGAQYYSLKPLGRKYGFALKEFNEPELCNEESALRPAPRSWLTEEKFKELMGKLFDLTGSVLENLAQGEFTPSPADTESCNSCRWKDICRASHLQ